MKTPFHLLVAMLLLAGTNAASDVLPLHYRLRPLKEEQPADPPPEKSGKGVGRVFIRSLRGGSAEFRTPGLEWAPAKLGFTSTEGVTFRTKAGCTMDLFLGENGPVVRMTPETTLAFDRLRLEINGSEKIIETRLNLIKGRIRGSVKKMAPQSKYEVKTPFGVAGIRGTEFNISANGNISVISGSVLFWDRRGKKSVNLQPGQSIFPRGSEKNAVIGSLFETQ